MQQTDPKATRPGWPEIGVGLLVLAIVGYGGGSQLYRLGLPPVAFGLVLSALSGIAGLAGFACAVVLRIRTLEPFGMRRIGKRWLLIGVLSGVVAFVLKAVVLVIVVELTGVDTGIQDVYGTGGSGGILSFVLATLFLAVLTPIGEEFLFRGVVANALLRYGPVIGVVGSAVIFGLMHGINIVLPAALIAGLVAAELFRRTGSVWPGVVMHMVFNLPTIPVLVLAGTSQ